MLAQALVERGLIDSFISGVWSALVQVDYYVGEGNTKWALVALAVVMAFLLRPRR